jgi:hypothetical protein
VFEVKTILDKRVDVGERYQPTANTFETNS